MTYCVGAASADVLIECGVLERGRRRRRRGVVTAEELCRCGQSAGIEAAGCFGR